MSSVPLTASATDGSDGRGKLPEVACEPARAIERLGGMRTLYANVVARFLDDSAGNLERVRDALSAGDIRMVQQSAHSLKGLAAMCGAIRVESVLAELESITSDSLATQQGEFRERLERAIAESHSLLKPFRQASQ